MVVHNQQKRCLEQTMNFQGESRMGGVGAGANLFSFESVHIRPVSFHRGLLGSGPALDQYIRAEAPKVNVGHLQGLTETLR
jgi:hypothetical protein